MSTPHIHIKLTRLSSGLTRKVAFTTRPAWEELAARVETLYEIPSKHVVVSYIDSEGDEVTMNTETELQNFYSAQPGLETIRFVVRDLRNPRDSSPGSAAPGASTSAHIPASGAGAEGYTDPAIQFAHNMANVIASFAEMGGANREVVDGIRTAVRRGAPLWQQVVPGFQFGPYPPPPGPSPPPFGGRHRHRGPPGTSPRRHVSRSPPLPPHSDSDLHDHDHRRFRRDQRHGHRHHGPPPPPAFPGAWPPPPPPPPVNFDEFVHVPHDAGDDAPPMPGAVPPPPRPTQDGVRVRPHSHSPDPRSSRQIEADLLTSFFGVPGASGAHPSEFPHSTSRHSGGDVGSFVDFMSRQAAYATSFGPPGGSGLLGTGAGRPFSAGMGNVFGTGGTGSYGVDFGGPFGASGPWGPNVSTGARMHPYTPPYMWSQFDTSARRRSTRNEKGSSSESEADEKK